MRISIAFFPTLLREIRWWALGFAVVFGIALAASLIAQNTMDGLLIAVGVFLLFFLPGFPFTYLLLPPGTTWWLLRFLLSLVFSLALEPLTVFIFSRFGMPVTLKSSYLVALSLTLFGFLLAFVVHRRFSRERS